MADLVQPTASPLDLQDYLDATNDASKRARLATIVVVTGSVLVFVGLLNSFESNWMLERLRKMVVPNSGYIREKLAIPSGTPAALVEKIDDEYFQAALKSYVESAYSIKVPFFGVTFDINDLGLIGGLGLLIAQGFLWFSLSRERDNLRWSFSAAKSFGDLELRKLYQLLAMRQVLTTPPADRQRKLLEAIPKVLVILPLVVQTSVVLHDISTLDLGRAVDDTHTLSVLLAESVAWAFILATTLASIAELRSIDGIWQINSERLFKKTHDE